ncbi:hypothetical protein ACO34A_13630 [Rhizobium sp. ACO-34A]|nr:hypothetical protein ACO34A_13630 [Rhizobium sp. ACO-34A]
MLNFVSADMPASRSAFADAWLRGSIQPAVRNIGTAFDISRKQFAGLTGRYEMGGATVVSRHFAPAGTDASPQPSLARNLTDRIAETPHYMATVSIRNGTADNREGFQP